MKQWICQAANLNCRDRQKGLTPHIAFMTRTSPRKVAKDFAKRLRAEQPDYQYLQAVFRHLRTELSVPVTTKPKKLPNIPTEEELKRYYEAVWTERNSQDLLIV